MLKIAFPTDDGERISAHLGQARFFKVIQVNPGEIHSAELREKASHNHHDPSSHVDTSEHPGQAMIDIISDCNVLIAGGMGQPMYQRASARGLEVVLTGEKQIEAALQSYLDGKLGSDLRRVHQH